MGEQRGLPSGRTTLGLLWMAGISIRLTVLAVPPVLPAIHHQLHLTEGEIGALTALPVFMLAVAAVPGSLLVSRLGARRALMVGLFVITVAGALRGATGLGRSGAAVPLLFLLTVLMGAGMAVCQPSLPSLVREWMPRRIGIATATYSNGILVGEILPVAITASLLAPWLGGWQPAIAVWSLPVAASLLAVLFLTRHQPEEEGVPPARWFPDWGDKRVWLIGLTLGGASASYWGANAFIPELLRHQHHPEYITAALTSLNLLQVPSSLVVAMRPWQMIARIWPLCLAGVLTIVGGLGVLLLPPVGLVAAAGLMGFASAGVFVLALALPPLVAADRDTHRMSAAMFTISYTCPFIGSLLSGALWDLTGITQSAFLAILGGGIMMAVFPLRLDFSAARQRLAGGPPPDPEMGLVQ